MPTSISLPCYLTARSPLESISVCREILDSDDDVGIDASRLKFADPFGIALLGAAFHGIQSQGFAVSVSGLNTDAGQYLRRMDVFHGVTILESQPSLQRHNRSDSLVELTFLDNANGVDPVARKLAHAIVGTFPDIDPGEPPDEMSGYTTFDRLVEPLQYVLSELLENALTHARRAGYHNANVWVAAQFFPTKKIIRLAVVDNGCGFLRSLRGHAELKHDSHHAAILLALRPRVSCNRELGILPSTINQGVGLTTARRIIERAGGRMLIVSGDAAHQSEKASSSYSSSNGRVPWWQGVAIGIEMRRDLLKDVRLRELLPELEETSLPPLRFE